MSGASNFWKMEKSRRVSKENIKRSGVMWSSEELNKKAARYIRENANVKRQPNLTAVNGSTTISCTSALISEKILLETARKWMLELGFNVVRKKKGTYVDGHERDDVVEYRQQFLQRIVSLMKVMLRLKRPRKHCQAIYMVHKKLRTKRSSFSMMNRPFNQTKISPRRGLRKGQMLCSQNQKGVES